MVFDPRHSTNVNPVHDLSKLLYYSYFHLIHLLFLFFVTDEFDEEILRRIKRQQQQQKPQEETDSKKTDDSYQSEICKDKDAGEWFRLQAGEGDSCRDVIQCTSSVSIISKNSYNTLG